MSETNQFAMLGKHLRYVREEHRESLAEVSGAVEIDETTLARIEAGHERPSEEILLLLISHFGVHDHEALKLWELADYGTELPEQLQPDIDMQSANKVVMLVAMDLRTIYTDGAEIVTTPGGVTLNFTQAAADNRTTPVARVGMSYDQAEVIVKQLSSALLYAKNQRHKQLPSGDTQSS